MVSNSSSSNYSLQPETYSLKMGIRFLCPNGHKLNVKAFLAGKRGICPDCDAKFLVPHQSGVAAVPLEAAPEAPIPEPESPATPESPSDVEAPPVVPSETLPTSIDQSLPDTWYVRPVSGEQYGPANTELIQTWVSEGRVASDSWVWRTGWDSWKIAHEVFELIKAAPTTTPSVQAAQQDADFSISLDSRMAKSNSRKERARQMTVMLGTLVLVLMVVLALVLWFRS